MASWSIEEFCRELRRAGIGVSPQVVRERLREMCREGFSRGTPMYAGSLSLSAEEVVEAFTRYVIRRSRQSRVITVTAKRIARELDIGRDPIVLTRVGMVLAELKRLGLLEARRSRRPKKYVVTEPGVAWATAG